MRRSQATSHHYRHHNLLAARISSSEMRPSPSVPFLRLEIPFEFRPIVLRKGFEGQTCVADLVFHLSESAVGVPSGVPAQCTASAPSACPEGMDSSLWRLVVEASLWSSLGFLHLCPGSLERANSFMEQQC